MRLSSYMPVAIAITAAAGLSIFSATLAVDRIEDSARRGLARAMAEAGHGWVRVTVDGLQVVLTGTAPDEAERFGAISAAGTVIDATRIIDRMDVRPTQIVVAPEFSVEFLRNVDGISLIGLVPASTDRAAVLDRIGRIASAPVTDLLEVGDYPTPEGWDAALDYALGALATIPRAKVSVTADRVAVTGIVDSVQVKRRVETELARTAPAGMNLSLDIAAPRPVIAPFTARFLINENGPRFDACAADTPEARDKILSAASKAGLNERTPCQIGLGAPSLAWGEAVAAGIETVARLGGGSVTFSDADISLIAPASVPVSTFDREIGELERVLPDGFSLTAVREEPLETDQTVGAGDNGPPIFSATLSPEGEVQLRGRLPSERVRTAVESYAHAHFGRDATYAAARLDPELPDGWSLRVLTGLDALALLAHGAVQVEPDFLSVSGDTGNPDAQAEIAGLLSARLGDGARYDIDVSYVEMLDPLAGLPTPDECVSKLNTVLSVQKVTFEPGSSTVDGGGLQIIDQLAEILRDCQHVRMEIAGHTDSQGRESMNLRLSQERADAVLNAIMARRVLTSNLSAKGYGETVPIADNDTEEGREANRRIEFTLIVPEAPDEADAESEAAESGDAPDSSVAEAAEEEPAGDTDEPN